MEEGLLIHIIIGVSALLPGILMQFVNPKSQSRWMGYRTPMSLKSQETWEFANKYSAKACLWAGAITILTQLTLIFTLDNLEAQILITSGIMTLSVMGVLAITEIKLNNRFDNEGKLKNPEEDLF
ncbi:SdpI family protein [Roseivirga sp.]|uniref:SdpI family protein n=1 Tax=Roseivirga sp. TaxID=1964215 RepID=UPI003B52CCCC